MPDGAKSFPNQNEPIAMADGVISFLLNPLVPSVPFFGIGKRCRPRSDATECGV